MDKIQISGKVEVFIPKVPIKCCQYLLYYTVPSVIFELF